MASTSPAELQKMPGTHFRNINLVPLTSSLEDVHILHLVIDYPCNQILGLWLWHNTRQKQHKESNIQLGSQFEVVHHGGGPL